MTEPTNTPQAPERAQEAPEPRVKFGPRDNDVMSLSWAEECLTWLYENRKKAFGEMLLARNGIDSAPGRGRPANP